MQHLARKARFDMGEKPFIKFYPSDFLGGTSGLSLAERGAYITILCLIFDADGPIKRDDARLARRCGTTKINFQKALKSLMDDGKIIERDGFLMNKRAEKALTDRDNRTQNATYAASTRWNALEQKNEQKQGGIDAGAMRAQCGRNASQKPEPELDNTHAYACDADGVCVTEKNIWEIGVGYLQSTGLSQRKAKGLVGRWINSHSREKAAQAIEAARAAGTKDPAPFVVGVLKGSNTMDEAFRRLMENAGK